MAAAGQAAIRIESLQRLIILQVKDGR
ncbi:hypothetical protein CGLO_14643 [Colletotrichum gloeosporioides Cg-14]|uniref:Uncharacterized protein n=1 Tax=Colletotrichum gloeosporioides (strain Cg-14) TaxID=1237896 RepID=T0K0L4_COLGC|nr:hypothetical protein CGLO_14643 [Colletotrichum gloeosporioides Cg-14]